MPKVFAACYHGSPAASASWMMMPGFLYLDFLQVACQTASVRSHRAPKACNFLASCSCHLNSVALFLLRISSLNPAISRCFVLLFCRCSSKVNAPMLQNGMIRKRGRMHCSSGRTTGTTTTSTTTSPSSCGGSWRAMQRRSDQ